MRAITHPTRAEAERHVAALGRTTRYTDGGRPPLPRCDSGKWLDEEIRQGRLCRAPCPCPSRDAPDPACPYITTADAPIVPLRDGTYAVPITRTHTEARDERIDVDGVEVRITDDGAREVDDSERQPDDAEPEPDDREPGGRTR